MWFLVQFLNGINQLPVFERNAISGGVAFWAHVMGFVAGLVLVRVHAAAGAHARWSGGTPIGLADLVISDFGFRI